MTAGGKEQPAHAGESKERRQERDAGESEQDQAVFLQRLVCAHRRDLVPGERVELGFDRACLRLEGGFPYCCATAASWCCATAAPDGVMLSPYHG